jgi:hypothetical protein
MPVLSLFTENGSCLLPLDSLESHGCAPTTTKHHCTMMTPEAAAYLLFSLAEQEQHEQPQVNLSLPFNDIRLPPAADIYYRPNRYRIQSILQVGLMPKVYWQKVRVEVIFQMTRFLHRKVRTHVDSVSLYSTKQAKVVDADALLSKEKADIYVLNDDFMVYVATFSIDVCRHIYSVAAQMTNVSVHLDRDILHGIKAVGNSDQIQMSEEAVYTANFGGTVGPQQSKFCSKS